MTRVLTELSGEYQAAVNSAWADLDLNDWGMKHDPDDMLATVRGSLVVIRDLRCVSEVTEGEVAALTDREIAFACLVAAHMGHKVEDVVLAMLHRRQLMAMNEWLDATVK